MLDIKFIREHGELVREGARRKRLDFDLEALLASDDKRLKLRREVEDLRAKQNAESERIAALDDPREKKNAIERVRAVKENLGVLERDLKEAEAAWGRLMLEVPNVPDPTVPDGGEEAAREERRVGTPRVFDFTPKDHLAILEALDLADFERGVKVSGFRGYFLKNEAVLLSHGLWLFTLGAMRRKGYTPLLAPALVREENLYGTGHFPQAREDVYAAGDELFLSATAEVPTTGLYAGEVLEEETLPKKFVAFSPCYRREAGAHGKDTRGIYRLHEFYKVEQMILAQADHQETLRLHEELTANAESILQALGLPYRVVTLAAGDIGRAHVKTYDIEVWIPSEKRYRESHSSSYYHDFQTRRLNIRYRDAAGKIRFAYTLNNTAVATPRLLIALLENYQCADGRVQVPEVLRPYVGAEMIG